MSRKWKAWGAFAIVLAMIGVANAHSDDNSASKSNSQSSISRTTAKSADKSSEQSKASDQSSSEHHLHKPVAKKKRYHSNSNGIANLAAKNYRSGDAAYINVNGGNSTLKASAWKNNHIKYADLDSLNRTANANTAYLESRNVANDSLRTSQTFYPTGWHQKFINNEAIINRGHMIAYSLSKGISINGDYDPSLQSGDQNNPKNLFTQTAFSNQRVQTIYESRVRNALRNGEKVIYQVQPIFRGDELMARGVHLQALSTDGSLNFNVYLFNVQPGVQFDYATGRSTIDNNMIVPTPAGAPTFSNHRNYYHHSAAKTAIGAYGAYRIYHHYRYRHYYYRRPYFHYYYRHYYYRRPYFHYHYRHHD